MHTGGIGSLENRLLPFSSVPVSKQALRTEPKRYKEIAQHPRTWSGYGFSQRLQTELGSKRGSGEQSSPWHSSHPHRQLLEWNRCCLVAESTGPAFRTERKHVGPGCLWSYFSRVQQKLEAFLQRPPMGKAMSGQKNDQALTLVQSCLPWLVLREKISLYSPQVKS